MISVIYGDDRVRAKKEIEKILGKQYEIIEGAELGPADMPNIFRGNTLFGGKRKILIRDFFANKAVSAQIVEYLDTEHEIVMLEMKLDKRASAYKAIKDKIAVREYALPKNPNMGVVFDIYKTAKKDGVKAVKMLDSVKEDEDPIMFCGLMVSQALKEYRVHQGTKEKRALKELSKLDLDLKSTSLQPWMLVQSFLLRVSSL